jgi:flagellar hook protein FlgE
MYTGLSGINVNQTRIDNIGNNIANVNTTAYKGTRTLFQTQFFQTLSFGTPPSDTSGGVNPTQLGRGAVVGAIQRDFSPGSIETTGINSDLAVQGNGFFVIRRPSGQQVYTRDGSFSVSSDNKLVTADGNVVRGFGVDERFNIVPNVLTDLTIPLGTLSVARATENVILDGDLSADGTIATTGTELTSQPLVAGGGSHATAATALTDLRSASVPGTVLFAAGDTITVSGVTKGDREIPSARFVVGTDGNTLGDFAAWLERTLAIDKTAGVPGNPGVTISGGSIIVRGNAGEPNAIAISANDILSSNATTPLPFQFTETVAANGSGVFTAFTVYDSLGTPLQVNATFTLEALPATGPVWRYYVESPENAGNSRVLGTGTVAFDTAGNFLSAAGNQFNLDRTGSGAASPVSFTLDFTGIHGLSTAASNVIMADQDGFPPGTLTSFSVGPDGVISGTFSNGLNRNLGQVALAVFPNAEGLVAESDNLFTLGPNAGSPSITAPGLFGAGSILSGALELSNVDLSREFIGLITSSTGFQAASRVISVSSDLLDQLLLVTR